MDKLTIIVLAAGRGTRMRSVLPKVLHPLAGKPMLTHIVETCQQLHPSALHIIYGQDKAALSQELDAYPVHFIHQREQKGTGHAVQQALPFILDDEMVLILYGDTPLISATTLCNLIKQKSTTDLVLLTDIIDTPKGYGRIVRDDNKICGIVEEKDASPSQKTINEIYSGILVTQGQYLKAGLSQLTNDNAQKEYYLTDFIHFAYQQHYTISAVQPEHGYEIQGVNDRSQLAQLERIHQKNQALALMLNGVTLHDPSRFDLRGQLTHGIDVTIDANVIIEGNVSLGNHVVIGAGCLLKNCHIGDYSIISPYTIIENSTVGDSCTLGPFARLRPGCELCDHVHIGNFVEAKKSVFGSGTKAGHLTYLGDTQLGKNVNVGAGTITCNYDGVNKHKTTIGDNVFIGSDVQFIAPVTIHDGVTIAAGTTVTDDVEEDALVIGRTRQQLITTWQRPKKK